MRPKETGPCGPPPRGDSGQSGLSEPRENRQEWWLLWWHLCPPPRLLFLTLMTLLLETKMWSQLELKQ